MIYRAEKTGGNAEVSFRRIEHAAHYIGGGGHDLEEWTYAQPQRLPRPAAIPASAEYHVGFLDRSGVQHWTYTRIAKLTDCFCKHCSK